MTGLGFDELLGFLERRTLLRRVDRHEAHATTFGTALELQVGLVLCRPPVAREKEAPVDLRLMRKHHEDFLEARAMRQAVSEPARNAGVVPADFRDLFLRNDPMRDPALVFLGRVSALAERRIGQVTLERENQAGVLGPLAERSEVAEINLKRSRAQLSLDPLTDEVPD